MQGNDRQNRINDVISLLASQSSLKVEEDLERQVSKKLLIEQCLPKIHEDHKTRKHRKTHGKIGFVEMSKVIGIRWKILPKEKVHWYKDLSKIDVERYRKAMMIFNKPVCEGGVTFQ